jgi:hypothetical protein
MTAKIFRILGVIGFILSMGSLSACFEESYYPRYPGYAYGSPAYAYPECYPRYVPAPRYYAYNPRPYARYRQRWEHEEHEEHEWHEHHHHHDVL